MQALEPASGAYRAVEAGLRRIRPTSRWEAQVGENQGLVGAYELARALPESVVEETPSVPRNEAPTSLLPGTCGEHVLLAYSPVRQPYWAGVDTSIRVTKPLAAEV